MNKKGQAPSQACLEKAASALRQRSEDIRARHKMRIINLIKQHGQIAQKAIVRELGLPQSWISRLLSALRDEQMVERSRCGKECIYSLAQAQQQQNRPWRTQAEEIAPGHRRVSFGDQWRPGRAQTCRGDKSLTGCALVWG